MRTLQTTEDVHIGQLATYVAGTDRYPYIVVKHTESKKTIWLDELASTPAEGYDYISNQVYEYSVREPESRQIKATLRKDGRYRIVGATNYGVVWLGVAERYSDPHF